jgi:hypothetical protein
MRAQLDLGREAVFWPSDEALEHWRRHAHGGVARIVYVEPTAAA